MTAEALYRWLGDRERPTHLDEIVAVAGLPRWRLFVLLRSRPDLFVELQGQRWKAAIIWN